MQVWICFSNAYKVFIFLTYSYVFPVKCKSVLYEPQLLYKLLLSVEPWSTGGWKRFCKILSSSDHCTLYIIIIKLFDKLSKVENFGSKLPQQTWFMNSIFFSSISNKLFIVQIIFDLFLLLAMLLKCFRAHQHCKFCLGCLCILRFCTDTFHWSFWICARISRPASFPLYLFLMNFKSSSAA